MGNTTPWLSLAIWIPIAFGGLILAAGRDRNAGVIRTVALVGSLLGLLVTIPLCDAASTRPRPNCSSSRRPCGSSG